MKKKILIILGVGFMLASQAWAETTVVQHGNITEVSIIKSDAGQFNVILHVPSRAYHFGWLEAGKFLEASQLVTNIKRCRRVSLTYTYISGSAYNVTSYQMFF